MVLNVQPLNLSICASAKITWGWICWTQWRHFAVLQCCSVVGTDLVFFRLSVDVPGSRFRIALTYCIRTEINWKIWTKQGRAHWQACFQCFLDSFSDSQKFLPHAFKSLLVLYRVLFDFCSCKNFSISTSSLLVPSSAGLKFANVCSFYLPASSWRSNFFIFFVCIFLRTTRLFCGQDQF